MKVNKQKVLEFLHHALVPFLVVFRHLRTFVLNGFETIEEKLVHATLPTATHLTDKIIMVTGAGGLIGSEICQQLVQFQPAQILLVGNGPKSLILIESQLKKKLGRYTEIIPIIVNIQNKKQIFETVGRHMPEIIYHTSGHQQLFGAEEMPDAALYANVFGTNNVAEAANRHRVSTFVMISSEQAGKPGNLKDAAKRLAEMTAESVAMTSFTRYTIVRLPKNLTTKDSSERADRLIEHTEPMIRAVLNVLQAGSEDTKFSREGIFEQKDGVLRRTIPKQTEVSQIEMARLLKKLKTATDDEARKLVVSIIRQ